MDNVNKQVVEFFKSIGFTLIEIKSSVFRIEESTWVFQTDHKDHSVDASTILYEDAEKIYQDRNQAYTRLVEIIEELDKEIINMQGGLRNNVVDTKDLKEKIDTLYGVSN